MKIVTYPSPKGRGLAFSAPLLHDLQSKGMNIAIHRRFLLLISGSKVVDPYLFTFVRVGYNLGSEHKFLLERCRANDLASVDIFDKPFIDLQPFSIMMNGVEFKGSGLDKITGNPLDASVIPTSYAGRKCAEIEIYVRMEADEFVRVCSWLYRELPTMLTRFKTKGNLD